MKKKVKIFSLGIALATIAPSTMLLGATEINPTAHNLAEENLIDNKSFDVKDWNYKKGTVYKKGDIVVYKDHLYTVQKGFKANGKENLISNVEIFNEVIETGTEIKEESIVEADLVGTKIEESDVPTLTEEEFNTFNALLPDGESFIIKAEPSKAERNSYINDRVVTTKVASTRYNHGSDGKKNPKNWGRTKHDRAIRGTYCFAPTSYNVSVGAAYGPVSVSFAPPSIITTNCNSVPPSVKGHYSRVYNYNDVIVSKYKRVHYDGKTGKYKKTTYYSGSTKMGTNYIAKRSDN